MRLTDELALSGGLAPRRSACQTSAMPSETESLAVQLVRALSDAPARRLMESR